MPISERTLRKWRKEALSVEASRGEDKIIVHAPISELHRRVLKMTQELLDQHLLKK